MKIYIDYLNNGILSFEREELEPVDLYNEYVMTSLRTMWGMEKQKLEESTPSFGNRCGNKSGNTRFRGFDRKRAEGGELARPDG